MISFRLDGRSVVPPYLQIVQQVRQALRMGVLDVGDQLPTVREVVAATAINPNTVLKAYRDLEREGLVDPGRVMARSCCAARPARLPARTRGWPAAWPSGCRAPARPDWMTTRSNRCCASRCRQRPRRISRDPRQVSPSRDRDSRASEALPRGYRPQRLHHHRSRGPDIGADRPERRRQDHAPALDQRAGQAKRR